MFLNGVTIILCGDDRAFEGAAIAWATKVEKNHVMVSLPSKAPITSAILSNKVFSISVLGDGQWGVARQYGGSKQSKALPRDIHDLDFNLWDVPVVKNCRAHLLCNTIQNIHVNEQVVLIAEVSELEFFNEIPPLVYNHAEYFNA